MSYYGRHISGLWLSTTADYAENELPEPATETFTSTKQIVEVGRRVGAGLSCTYNLSSWTTIDYAYVYCHADSAGRLYVVCFGDPADLVTTSYHLVNPGRSLHLSDVPSGTGTIWGTASVSFAIFTYGGGEPDATFDVILLGD